MPNIIASPRNGNGVMQAGGAIGSGGNQATGSGVSIERINKNISDSINHSKGSNNHNKEIQLIQAYQ